MGPNCYISPGKSHVAVRCGASLFCAGSADVVLLFTGTFAAGGGYTQVHQDGHGTVDSGHSNLSGYNEVVMLRRLPECHKRNACQMVPAPESRQSTAQAQNILYKLPHDDGREDHLNWPTQETIADWTARG